MKKETLERAEQIKYELHLVEQVIADTENMKDKESYTVYGFLSMKTIRISKEEGMFFVDRELKNLNIVKADLEKQLEEL